MHNIFFCPYYLYFNNVNRTERNRTNGQILSLTINIFTYSNYPENLKNILKPWTTRFNVMTNSWSWEMLLFLKCVIKTKECHAISAPCYTLSKPQYTLVKSHHRIPSSILSGNSSLTLWHHAYFFKSVPWTCAWV